MAKQKTPKKETGKPVKAIRSGRASRPAKSSPAKTGSKLAKAPPSAGEAKGGNHRPAKPTSRKGKASRVRKPAGTPPFDLDTNETPAKANESPRVEQTRLTPAELEEFRQMLLLKRSQLIGDVANLESDSILSGSQGGGGSSSMPIHMADIGSDTWEQELTLGLIENERGLLREIDEALQRIKDRTFGICVGTGKPITKARLRAKPWAKYCIEYARKRELGLV